MPLTCPHCQIVQAEGNETCINCGQPLTPAPAAPDADAHPADYESPPAPDPAQAAHARRASRRLPALIAAGLLLALAASALFAVLRGPTRRPALTAQAPHPPTVPPVPDTVPPLPVSVPPSASAPPSPAVTTPPAEASVEAGPLTVTLISTKKGRHVKVGEDVTLTALAHGRSATLTLFYRRAHGRRTMLTFIEGGLLSTTWTPAVSGRYEFTATGLDDRRQAAASRRIEIIVDEPAPSSVARKGPIQEGPAQASPRVAAVPPLRPVRRLLRRAPPRTAAADVPPPVAGAETGVKTHHRNRLPALTYHVAAAKFPFLRNATVLSDALNRRGYRAVPEPMADAHGKAVYVVVTGSYRRPKQARAAALALQRSGYPAYFFGSR